MYRIELSPGEETVFRSIEELAVAIKRGVVSPRARIFHNATSKWLPIQFHPHYKAAVSMPLSQAALVAGPQSKSPSSLNLELPPEPEPEPPLPAPRPAAASLPAAEPPARKKKASSKRLPGESRSRRHSKPRQQLRIALVGALLIGGAQWVLSAPLFSRAQAPLLADVQRLIQVHTSAMKRVSEPNTAGMIPVLPSSANTATPEVLQRPPEKHVRVTTPSFGGNSAGETASRAEIVPVPASVTPIASLPPADSVLLPVDSTNRKTLQGVLTTVSGGGMPPAARTAPRR